MLQDNHFQRHRLILNMINHLGPISRTSLIQHTAYRPATVGAIVSELMERKLIVESGFQSSGQGRKRVLLEINKAHICAVGVYFTPAHAAFILSQFDGTILRESQLPLPPKVPKKELVATITGHVQALLQDFSDKFFVGIGICKPLVDPSSYRAPGLQDGFRARWIYDDLAPTLEKATGLSVEVFSGVTLPAQAEHRFGVAKGVNDFIWVELSNGIGTSIFSGGNALGGATGMAGELGHTVVSAGENRLCYCGKPDCVEASAAWPALIDDIRKALQNGVISYLQSYPVPPEELTVQDIRKALDAGDRMCLHHVRRAAERLGAAIANAIDLLNPALIVLYGFMLELGAHFLVPLEQSMREHAVFSSGDFQVKISTSSESIMPLGAVANIFSAYLQTEDYRWVYRL